MVKRTLFFVLILTLFSGTVYAQSRTEIEAFRLYKAAKADMEAGRFKKACKELDRAYELYAQPHILFRKAACLEAQDEPEKSLAVLERIKQVKHLSVRLQAKVKASITRLKILLAKPVNVTVVTPDAGATVVIDGKQTCTSPCNLTLPRGDHSFHVSQQGYNTVTLTRNIRGFAGKVINVRLKRIMQKINIAVRPSNVTARVMVDGNTLPAQDQIAQGAWSVVLPVGKHTLTVTASGYDTFFKDFTVKQGKEANISCYLSQAGKYWTKKRIGGWVMVGVGAGLTIGGIAVLASYYNDKKVARNTGKILKSNKQYWGPVLIGVGVVTAGCSYFLLRKTKKHKKGVQSVSLGVTPNGTAYVGATLRF